ncbi:MAG: DUF2800 domain-containing protein [Rhodoplanes sp.]|uniref:DUF2800 domain-containing protein n=1 Tax=Rhodoplanes sp. TaxID=1968906 RepID=UPI0017F2FE3C|nr:DUF2800 domain-containing protein [Rhodoplanes sp.]NVO13841.1 DUF2800 domain-containing protein [Rhodoplanes sp.]
MSAGHAIYAPSSSHRWAEEGGCTASAMAIAALPPEESGEEADEGTAAHDEIERLIPLTEIRKGDHLRQYFRDVIDPDHPAAYGIALALDFVAQLPPGRLWVEQTVRLTDQIWGRCDVAHYEERNRVLTILDYKNGFVDVQAESNPQPMIYAAAAILTHGLRVDWVRIVIVQPNSFLPVPRVKQWIVSAADLHTFATRVAAIPHQPLRFVAGEQCKYCPLFGRCPASADVLSRIGVAFARDARVVPDYQVALFLAMKKPIADWFKTLEKTHTNLAISGHVPDGMKLVTANKHRAWADPDAARELIYVRYGIEALDPPAPAQAEKLGMTAAELKVLAPTPPGSPVLAFENDNRPAWKTRTSAEMFAGVTGVK